MIYERHASCHPDVHEGLESSKGRRRMDTASLILVGALTLTHPTGEDAYRVPDTAGARPASCVFVKPCAITSAEYKNSQTSEDPSGGAIGPWRNAVAASSSSPWGDGSKLDFVHRLTLKAAEILPALGFVSAVVSRYRTLSRGEAYRLDLNANPRDRHYRMTMTLLPIRQPVTAPPPPAIEK
jgi:hypothetical protein